MFNYTVKMEPSDLLLETRLPIVGFKQKRTQSFIKRVIFKEKCFGFNGVILL